MTTVNSSSTCPQRGRRSATARKRVGVVSFLSSSRLMAWTRLVQMVKANSRMMSMLPVVVSGLSWRWHSHGVEDAIFVIFLFCFAIFFYSDYEYIYINMCLCVYCVGEVAVLIKVEWGGTVSDRVEAGSNLRSEVAEENSR